MKVRSKCIVGGTTVDSSVNCQVGLGLELSPIVHAEPKQVFESLPAISKLTCARYFRSELSDSGSCLQYSGGELSRGLLFNEGLRVLEEKNINLADCNIIRR